MPNPSLLDRLQRNLARRPLRRIEPPAGAARAAIMAVLRSRRDDVDLCMIKRSHHPLDRFSGHMALPGGAEEDGDADMLSTAVRETFEEIGLDVEKHAKVAGRLDDEMPSVPPGGAGRVYVVTPFVCVLTADADVAAKEKSEVEEVFWMPASDMARGAADGEKPEFLCRGRRIWGMTARVVRSLLEALP